MAKYYVDATVKIWLKVEGDDEKDAKEKAEEKFGFGEYHVFSFEVDQIEED